MAADDGQRDGESEWLRAAASTPTDAAPRSPGDSPVHGDVIAGKYRIEHMIGAGGMGTVYKATHVVMDSPVAVKWLIPSLSSREEARERFVREARAAARIRHPNVVQVFDVGEQDGALYMVMELLEGEPFDAVIERGHMPIPQALQLLVQAMWGVGAAHERGIVHRDIKPDNIFVVKDPTQPTGLNAKVLDFGISKLSEDDQRASNLTKTGVTMGTPAYMSLEQINGARDVDARTDVYAFGVLMYRALTGRLPFDGETFGAIAVAAAMETPPTPKELRPDLPASLSEVVMRAMARDREDRYATVQALLEELKSLSTAEGYLGQMTQPSTVPPSLTPKSANRLKKDADEAAASAAARAETPSEAPATETGRKLAWVAALVVLLGAGLALALSWPDAEGTEPVVEVSEEGADVDDASEHSGAEGIRTAAAPEPAVRGAEGPAPEATPDEDQASSREEPDIAALPEGMSPDEAAIEAAPDEAARAATAREQARRRAAERRHAEQEAARRAAAERARKAEEAKAREARRKAEAEKQAAAKQRAEAAEAKQRERAPNSPKPALDHRSGGFAADEL